MKSCVVSLIISFTVAFVSYSQTGVETGTKFGFGEDSIRCGKNLSLYDQEVKQKLFDEAYEPWLIAFNECPLSTINLYSHGVKIVSYMYERESNTETKEAFYQLLMQVYDQRAKYFGTNRKYPTPYIMGLKAIDMLEYKGNEIEVKKQAYVYLSENITQSPESAQLAIISSFFSTSIALFQAQDIRAEQVVKDYVICTEWLNKELAVETKPQKIEDLKKMSISLENMFISSGVASCETLGQLYDSLIDSKVNDIQWLKNSNKILLKQDCEDSEILNRISLAIYKIEPTADAAYSIARTHLKKKELSSAKEYYNQAIELESEPVVKAKYLYQLGLILSNQGDLVGAKAKALQAISNNSSYGEPYILLGKLYAQGASNYGKNDFEHKTVFWAAVDKFNKAKEVDPKLTEEVNQQIASMSIHYPANEELFFQGLKAGDSYQIGDWINEKTTVRLKK